jgi:hypothetical protein
LKVFDENKEDDLTELSHRLNDIRAEMEYPLTNHKNNFAYIVKTVFVCDVFGRLLKLLSASPFYVHLLALEPHCDAVLEIHAEELSNYSDELHKLY